MSERLAIGPIRLRATAAWLLAAALALVAPGLPAGSRALAAQPKRLTAPELDLKSAYLLSFVRFARRADAPAAASAPVRVAILADDELARAMTRVVQGKRIDGREIAVSSLREPDSLRSYDMVFVGVSVGGRLPRTLELMQGAPVLTVGESEDFVARGGMIELFFEERKLRFAINADAAERAGLRLSASLLSLASDVRGRGR